MSTTIGEAVIKLSFNTKDLDKGQQEVANKIDNTLGKVGSVAKVSGLAIAAGIKVAETSVKALATASIKGYAEYEQLEGGMQKIFNEVDYNKIAEDAQNAYKTMNISASQYMETIAGVGATFAQTMGDQKVPFGHSAILGVGLPKRGSFVVPLKENVPRQLMS